MLRPLPRRALLLSTVALAVLPLAACGDDDRGGGSARPDVTIKVSAAASLKKALEGYQGHFAAATVAFSFAGSDELAAQIEQGVRPDVFAAANTKLPDALHAKGLVGRPVRFATNRLVVAVPAEGGDVRSFADLGRDGVSLAIGSPTVPVGAYTRTVLGRLSAARRKAIEGNVRSQEPDVAGVVGKLTQGAVDAGFVYRSDVRAAGGRLREIAIPDALQPAVTYGVAVVAGAPHRGQAQAFVDGLVGPDGQAALRAAGLGPKP
ncbi:Molybdenum ABC transporter periplasmic molybdenum-binding protein ModA (TC 3.A.1.8.1) [Patulibacter medicamentivorans]|jgi:molybdate transport system substrate-binding protein|uniref:Molybdenum ABC transporter periplasmic molybdenum-binding protein ModA (TC 3.A.1.8.1) n=1 Tax=Patulibacter medicamentivorans TaxID=1097667 RepID=H0E2W3_9ACTN|nr:molybdate ABC transporter substrate-binding protein [Patulibacter medicamentivorans]EHN11980.1 Molybdenum ABC transporter periplasmic molybdenum-binding protein ModA (TC 3.A.1.8.1) [Patulibacter medicamentivorans]